MTKSTGNIFLFVLFSINIPLISQTSHFSLGTDLIYSYSQVKSENNSYGNPESKENWKGNFSPGIKLRYGNKLAGVFRSGYIRYVYFYDDSYYSAAGGGAFYTTHIESTVNNIYTECYLEYAVFEKEGIFFYAGPAMAIPVRIKQSTTNTVEGYQNTRSYDEEFVNSPYFADFQCVVGLGGRILINRKSAICLESNFRFGIKKMDTGYLFNSSHDYNNRTYSIQFIIGYQRNFSDKE